MRLFGKKQKNEKLTPVSKLIDRPRVAPSAIDPPNENPRLNTAKRVLVEDFYWFQPYLNWSLSDHWAVHDTGSDVCTIGTYDQPNFGRGYQVMFGQAKLGTLEVVCGPAMWTIGDEEPKAREATINLRLAFLEYLLFEEAYSLVFHCARAVQQADDLVEANRTAKAEATFALTSFLWERMQTQATYDVAEGVLQCSFTGPYGVYQSYINRWKEQGIDPMRDWNGDRPSK